MIDSGTVEQVLESAQVEEVIGDFVTLKKRGANYVGLCPFHNEKTPSFTVSPSKGIFKCFGCGQAGNSAKFLMEHEHFSFPESIRFLAEKYNIEVEETEDDKEAELSKDKKEGLYIINQFAQKYYSQNLFDTDEGKSVGLSYFKERGYREETIKKFNLGYSLSNANGLTETALGKGYQLEYLKELGLTQEKNGRRFDFFRERVQFTIHNLSGKVIAFAGRTLSSGKKIPKYINSPESPIYHKSKVLYGAFFAKNAIRKEDLCYLVEGYTDVISLHQNGIENVVASSGTSLTEDQVRLIKRYSPNITILYDGDEAGIKAATRGLDIVLEQGLNVKVVVLPEGEDPDSYIKSVGAKMFKEYVKEQGQDFIFFKAGKLAGEVAHDPVKKTAMIKDIVATIAKIPDPIKRSLYIRECSTMMEVQEQLLVNEINRIIRGQLKRQGQKRPTFTEQDSEDLARKFDESAEKQVYPETSEYQERDLMRLLLEHGVDEVEKEVPVAVYILNALEGVTLENVLYQKLGDIYREHLEREELPTEKFFINHKDQEIAGLAIDLLTEKYEISQNWTRMHEIHIPEKGQNFIDDVKSAVARYLLKKVNSYIQQTLQELKEATDEEEVKKLQRAKIELDKLKMEYSEMLNTVIVK